MTTSTTKKASAPDLFSAKPVSKSKRKTSASGSSSTPSSKRLRVGSCSPEKPDAPAPSKGSASHKKDPRGNRDPSVTPEPSTPVASDNIVTVRDTVAASKESEARVNGTDTQGPDKGSQDPPAKVKGKVVAKTEAMAKNTAVSSPPNTEEEAGAKSKGEAKDPSKKDAPSLQGHIDVPPPITKRDEKKNQDKTNTDGVPAASSSPEAKPSRPSVVAPSSPKSQAANIAKLVARKDTSPAAKAPSPEAAMERTATAPTEDRTAAAEAPALDVRLETTSLDTATSLALLGECLAVAEPLATGTYHRRGAAALQAFVASGTVPRTTVGRVGVSAIKAMPPALEAIAMEDPAQRRVVTVHVMDTDPTQRVRNTVLVPQGRSATVLVVGGACSVTLSISAAKDKKATGTVPAPITRDLDLADGAVLTVTAPDTKNVTVAARRRDTTKPAAIVAFLRGVVFEK